MHEGGDSSEGIPSTRTRVIELYNDIHALNTICFTY